MPEEGPGSPCQPRLENQEADDLTNLEFKSFSDDKRLDVNLESLDFGVLRQLFDVGDAHSERREARRDCFALTPPGWRRGARGAQAVSTNHTTPFSEACV